MIIKLNQPINDYDWVLAFDIAKKITGYSLLDYKKDEIILTGVIDTSHCDQEIIWDYFLHEIKEVILVAKNEAFNHNKKFFITKEKLPTQNGRFTTIDTLQTLAQAHAIFDLAVFTSVNPIVYDYEGVHSVSVRAYFKKILNVEKPSKEDIALYLKQHFKYDFGNSTLDVTDSLAVSLTLLGKKYITDIKTEVATLRKEMKAAQTLNKKERIQNKITALENLL